MHHYWLECVLHIIRCNQSDLLLLHKPPHLDLVLLELCQFFYWCKSKPQWSVVHAAVILPPQITPACFSTWTTYHPHQSSLLPSIYLLQQCLGGLPVWDFGPWTMNNELPYVRAVHLMTGSALGWQITRSISQSVLRTPAWVLSVLYLILNRKSLYFCLIMRKPSARELTLLCLEQEISNIYKSFIVSEKVHKHGYEIQTNLKSISFKF